MLAAGRGLWLNDNVRRDDTFMKIAFYISALAVSLLTAGCSQSPQPLDSGTPLSGTVWEHPLSYPLNNSGGAIPKDARVDVYDHCIIIHRADGSRQIVSLDFVTDLRLK